jgi:hypothetical protein
VNLAAAICAFVAVSSPNLARHSSADLPFVAPAGWKSEKQDKSIVLTPSDVATGKFYVVMITPVEGKAGSLDSILDSAKAMAAETGTFTAAIEPKQSKSDGGWDYKFIIGTIEVGGKNLLAQLMAVKKGDEGGVVIVLSESVETMTQYANTFAAMIRAMGATAPVAAPSSSGVVDLQYSVPPGWVKSDISGFPLLVKEKNEQWTKYRVSLLIFPTEILGKDIRTQFVGYWNDFVTPNYTTKIAPIPLLVRLKSGQACAFDAEWDAVAKNGSVATVALYLIAHGGKVVPVLGIFAGPDWMFGNEAENEIANFLDTAKIPGASAAKVKLFSATNLVGEWSESSTSYATYVTRSGAYAGDATISTASYLTLGGDGSYKRTLLAVGAAGNIREKDAGTWTVDDDELVLSKGGRYSLLGYGNDPKIGRFMVIGNYSNQKSRLKFTNPRGILQAMWMKAK